MTAKTTAKTALSVVAPAAVAPAAVVAPTFPDVASLAPSPYTPASLSRVDPLMPAGSIVLGRDAWEHYALIAEGAYISGEIVAIVSRDETGADGEITRRHLLVLRATVPVHCAATYDDPSATPLGELVKERVNGVEVTKDIYQIAPGVLFATNLRSIMSPFARLAEKAYACDAHIRVGKLLKLKSNAKQSYWDMSIAFTPLHHARDTSLDYLSGPVHALEATTV